MSTEPNYRRTKPGMKTSVPNSNGATGPASQIPGLSQSAEIGPVERTTGRRVGIQATDSDYVKLAKQGGHKGLLSHENTNDDGKSGNMYTPPSWFSAEDGHQSQSKGSSLRLMAPFGTDDGPTSEDMEPHGSAGAGDQTLKASPVSPEAHKLNLSQKDIQEANKFKRMSHEKKAAVPVSMSKLLSFGYADEEKKSPDEDASSMTSEQTSTIVLEDELE